MGDRGLSTCPRSAGLGTRVDSGRPLSAVQAWSSFTGLPTAGYRVRIPLGNWGLLSLPRDTQFPLRAASVRPSPHLVTDGASSFTSNSAVLGVCLMVGRAWRPPATPGSQLSALLTPGPPHPRS